jgi:hypothetical protein
MTMICNWFEPSRYRRTQALYEVHRPFVPHNLISASNSHFPLSEFQMTFPDLKSLCPLGPRKELRCTIPFSLKANALQVPQLGPYGEIYLPTGHFSYVVCK